MQLDSDFALIGNGLAVLVAAHGLISQGKTVVILNPDPDFFRENSELSLDPLLPEDEGRVVFPIDRVKSSAAEEVARRVGAHYPGAAEQVVRSRMRLLLQPSGPDSIWDWEQLEERYIALSDAGVKPQLLEGFQALKRFPGYAGSHEQARALGIPKLADVDTVRMRMGLLDFLRERGSQLKIVEGASDIEPTGDGLRLFARDSQDRAQGRSVRVHDSVVLFPTPRTSALLERLDRVLERKPSERHRPIRTDLWEEWTLLSRDRLDTSVTGVLGDLCVWAKSEHELTVLKPQRKGAWVDEESFGALDRVVGQFLEWDRFTVRGYQPRSVSVWSSLEPFSVLEGAPSWWVIPGGDGPVMQIVAQAERALTLGGPR